MVFKLINFLLLGLIIGPVVSSPQRFLLYDVNPVEGFNLRRDVYMRMANMVKIMQNNDPSWVLVLPPFTQMYHWKSVIDQSKLEWGKFFDVASLAKHVKVIEFDDFLEIAEEWHGKLKADVPYPLIDQYYQLQQDKEFFKTGEWREGVFPGDCNEDGELRKISGAYRGRLYGYTQFTAKAFTCLTTSADIKTFGNWLNQQEKVKVVMLGRAETIIHGTYSEWSVEWWNARRSMRYAQHLVDIANKYRLETFQSNDETDKTVLGPDWQIFRVKNKLVFENFLYTKLIHLERRKLGSWRPLCMCTLEKRRLCCSLS